MVKSKGIICNHRHFITVPSDITAAKPQLLSLPARSNCLIWQLYSVTGQSDLSAQLNTHFLHVCRQRKNVRYDQNCNSHKEQTVLCISVSSFLCADLKQKDQDEQKAFKHTIKMSWLYIIQAFLLALSGLQFLGGAQNFTPSAEIFNKVHGT